MKLGFFTGARSEYGLLKKLIVKLQSDSFFDVSILAGGMHLLKNFGNTYQEIEKDGFKIQAKIPFYRENKSPGFPEFTLAIKKIAQVLDAEKYDALFVVGDRLEAYAAALAGHFTKTPVIHFGGGTLTMGAVDNIYRYNISFLATIHFATSKGNHKRLINLPVLNREKVYLTGSVAIDAINEFQEKPIPVSRFLPGLEKNNFALLTFHPATLNEEPLDKILKEATEFILKNNCSVLITFPNNDKGFETILNQIEAFRSTDNVFIVDNLGAAGYYAALNDCRFLLGNSSSGIIEAPYFQKQVINVGTRQEEREKDQGITDVSAEWPAVKEVLKKGFETGWPLIKNQNIYGDGHAAERIVSIIKKEFQGND